MDEPLQFTLAVRVSKWDHPFEWRSHRLWVISSKKQADDDYAIKVQQPEPNNPNKWFWNVWTPFGTVSFASGEKATKELAMEAADRELKKLLKEMSQKGLFFHPDDEDAR